MIVVQKPEKHAYLILWHKNDSQLIRLLQTLDDERNDIYIHADKKTQGFSQDKLKNAVKRANVFFTKRIRVTWGGYSVVKATLVLLKESTDNGEYAYYHLLSGEDLPIKTQEYIHEFCQKNADREFVKIKSGAATDPERQEKLAYYRFFQELARKNSSFSKLFARAEKVSLSIQKRLNVNRIRGKENLLYSSSQWFSITHDFAKHILRQEKRIARQFRWTNCPDEVFVQSIVMNSGFRSRVHPNMRLIDWERREEKSHPHIFRKEDYGMLRGSDCLFARKFDETVDAEIIDRVVTELSCPQHPESKGY